MILFILKKNTKNTLFTKNHYDCIQNLIIRTRFKIQNQIKSLSLIYQTKQIYYKMIFKFKFKNNYFSMNH